MVRSRRVSLAMFGLALWVGTGDPSSARGQEPPPPTLEIAPHFSEPPPPPTKAVAGRTGKGTAAQGSTAVGRESMLALFTRANPMVWLLALCSVVTVGFALERLVALRRERVIPRDFVSRFLERLASGKLDRDRAAELCRANDSAAARVFAMVISYWGQPAATTRQAIGFDAAGELSDLKRNVRVLNGTATLAPLLGLLGTVIGMIQSFEAVSGKPGTAKGEALAHGISLALVTTGLGLTIAVVSVTAYYYLLNRVDILVRDLDENARRVIDLTCAESLRPTTDRRPTLAPPSDLTRHESSRIH